MLLHLIRVQRLDVKILVSFFNFLEFWWGLTLFYLTDYYYDADGGDHFDQSPAPGSILCDPEYVEYSCLDQQQVEDLFDKIVKELIESIPQNNLKPELAKLLLHLNKWDVEQVRICLMNDSKQFLIEVWRFFKFYF